jgi:predicted transglutaminase-like protease
MVIQHHLEDGVRRLVGMELLDKEDDVVRVDMEKVMGWELFFFLAMGLKKLTQREEPKLTFDGRDFLNYSSKPLAISAGIL